MTNWSRLPTLTLIILLCIFITCTKVSFRVESLINFDPCNTIISSSVTTKLYLTSEAFNSWLHCLRNMLQVHYHKNAQIQLLADN